MLAPLDGAVEWCCAPGDVVAKGATLAWLAGPGRCGLEPLVAPASGRVTWRRAGVLAGIEAGEPAVVLGEDDDGRAHARAREQASLEAALALVDEELQALTRGVASPLALALLEPQRAEAGRRRAALVAALTAR